MAKLEVDEELLKRLADILDTTGLTEIEVASGEERVRVAKQQTLVSTAVEAAPVPPAAAANPAADLGAAEGSQSGSLAQPSGLVVSPMVGTVYLAPAPTAQPFVKLGDQVSEGQTLMIVEAMKVMNNLPSPHAGTVKDILISDGQPVEYGEPLIVIA